MSFTFSTIILSCIISISSPDDFFVASVSRHSIIPELDLGCYSDWVHFCFFCQAAKACGSNVKNWHLPSLACDSSSSFICEHMFCVSSRAAWLCVKVSVAAGYRRSFIRLCAAINTKTYKLLKFFESGYFLLSLLCMSLLAGVVEDYLAWSYLPSLSRCGRSIVVFVVSLWNPFALKWPEKLRLEPGIGTKLQLNKYHSSNNREKCRAW